MNTHPYIYAGLSSTIQKFGLNTLLNHVAMKLNVDVEDLKSKSRDNRLVRARAIYCFLARENNHTLQAIAKEINRDHATVVYNVNLVKGKEFDFKIKKDFDKCNSITTPPTLNQ